MIQDNQPLPSQHNNNKHENSLKGSCHLRPSLNTTQKCESAFKLRTTIDHTGHVCNTLNPKLLIKHTNSDNLKLLLMSCSKFLLIGGLNTKSRWIDDSLPTDTTELSSMNVEYKKQRRSKLDQFHQQSRENWQKQK